ncbi:MAG: sensor histidine kinase [Actinomycetota bacterium]
MRSIRWQWPPLRDVALVAALLVMALVGLRSNLELLDGQPDIAGGPISVALVLATVLPLAYRRVAPLTVAIVSGAAFTWLRWIQVVEFEVSSVALFVAFYGVGAFADRRRTSVRLLVMLPSVILIAYRLIVIDGELAAGQLLWVRVSTIVLNVGFFAGAWVLGDGARRRREVEEQLRERSEELEREREENEQRAVLDERVRIARELHDVVAHHVSVMGLQAGAARRALEHDPESSKNALRLVEDSGREAVRELHQLLGFLRQDEQPDADPQPGLSRLHTLAEQVEEAGIEIDVEVDERLDDVPDSVAVSAYRIVQESLTNTLRHANARRASVCLRRDGDGLVVTVADDGAVPFERGPSADRSGRRHGLLGMRERALLHQGTFEAGPRPGGGWEVEARLALPAGTRR